MSQSKKNQNQTKTTNEEVVTTTEQVIEGEAVSTETNSEEVKNEAAEGATTEKAEVTVETEQAVSTETNSEEVKNEAAEEAAEEAATEEKVETSAPTETTKTPVVEPSTTDESGKDDKLTQATTLSAKTSSSDRYGDDIDDGDGDEGTSETPVTNPSTPTVTESEEIVDRALMNKELNTSYNVKFTYSEASKRFAINRKMTLLAMYDLFVKNRNAFVGLKSQDDFNHISEFMNKYSVLYNYKEIPKAGKRQFLDKLRSATDYVLLGR